MYNKMEDGQQYTNNTQETGKPDKCNINTAGIQKFNRAYNPMIIDNNNSKINDFIPGTNKKTRQQVQKSQKIYMESEGVFTGVECVNSTFSLQTNAGSKPYKPTKVCYQHITKAMQGGTRGATAA